MPISAPVRFCPVEPAMLVQFTLSVLICHWKVAAGGKAGYAEAVLLRTTVGST